MEDSFFGHAEHHVYAAAKWVQLGVEAIGVIVIAYGILFSLICYGKQLFGSMDADYIPLRLSLARYLVVALEFQLAADILATAVAPNWDGIGKLAAIAIIRTVLNYFLKQEMKEEVEEISKRDREKLEERMEGEE